MDQVGNKNDDLKSKVNLSDFPLSSSQEMLWVLNQQQKENPGYNLCMTFRLEGDLKLDIFRQSIDLVFGRQISMFSVFRVSDGKPSVYINKVPVEIQQRDLSDYDSGNKLDNLLSYLSSDLRRPFNIETGPLFRLHLIKFDDETHIFHLTVHHLIFDAFSMGIFNRELGETYNKLLASKKAGLKSLSVNSHEYALREHEELSDGSEKELASFWKEELKGHPKELKFPYDNQRGVISTGYGIREGFELNKKSTSLLRSLSLESGGSVFKTVLSVIGILFQRYSGENDICIGFPVSNRNRHKEFSEPFGMLVNTSIARIKVRDDLNFRQYLAETRDTINRSIKNSRFPFSKIVEAVNPERRLNVNPIVQVALSWWNPESFNLELSGIRNSRINVTEGVSPLDITFYMWENGDVIEGEIEYNTDILNKDTVLRLKENFISLIGKLSEHPDKPISEIDFISAADRKLLEEFNRTGSSLPQYMIHEMFENQVALRPGKKAVIAGNSSLTYRRLNKRANQLAAHLLFLGARNGDIIGVCLERSTDMVVTILGILKAGCCYVPMDPLFPEERLLYMYRDTGAKIIISQSSLSNKFSQFSGAEIVMIDKERQNLRIYRRLKPRFLMDLQSPAYIIYTSGSTGRPKGVPIHHEAVVNLIHSMLAEPGMSEKDVLLAVVTLSFDMSVYELFLPLSAGATVVIADNKEILNIHTLLRLINKRKITVLQATPSLWNILLASGWKGKSDMKGLCGGEALSKNLVRQVYPKVAEFWNCYGPTETTVYATVKKINDPEGPILIGKPLKNTRIYILDKHNNELPVGVTGEVCVAGLGLSKGYRNRPELNAEKFIELPNGEKIYRTGDLGRFLNDGNIELFGRSDNQIKIRGYRIELGEVETVLSGIEGVQEAVVKLHRFDENDNRLVAFLNIKSDFDMSKEQISKYVSAKLPSYMVPSFFDLLESFPRLPNGKIDKNALHFKAPEIDNGFTENLKMTEMQRKIYCIWSSVLRKGKFSVTDNFFNIGGNSLLAVTVMSEIESAFNIDLELKSFFDSPTVEHLAEVVELKTKGTAHDTAERAVKNKNATIIKGHI
jgi:polyketide synthase PksJ